MEFFTDVTDTHRLRGSRQRQPLGLPLVRRRRVVAGRRMEDHLRFAVCYWHSFAWDGFDIFGAGTLDRPWHPTFAPRRRPDGRGEAEDGRRFRVLRQARRAVLLLPRPRHRARGRHASRSRRSTSTRWSTSPPSIRQRTGVKLLWGTANLFSNPRYQAGAATNPDPEVFAFAAGQVAHCLEATHRLGGAQLRAVGRPRRLRDLLNTDMKRELDQLARFLSMVVEHKQRIGFTGTILLEPKPFEPTKHQYDYDVAAVHAFLQKYDLADEIKVNIEVNHATLAGHDFAHEIASAVNAGHLRLDRRQCRRRSARLGCRSLPGVGRADDAGHAGDPARRRLHDRRVELRFEVASPVEPIAPICSTPTSAGWTPWRGRCSPPRRSSKPATSTSCATTAMRDGPVRTRHVDHDRRDASPTSTPERCRPASRPGRRATRNVREPRGPAHRASPLAHAMRV